MQKKHSFHIRSLAIFRDNLYWSEDNGTEEQKAYIRTKNVVSPNASDASTKLVLVIGIPQELHIWDPAVKLMTGWSSDRSNSLLHAKTIVSRFQFLFSKSYDKIFEKP